LLSLNSASAAELETLPGIGPVLATNIVAYREAHGPFARIEDLLRVAGIGPAKLEQIQPFLQVP
jgi:competence protein ComEA